MPLKIEIIDEAVQDLINGFHFYKKQSSEVGGYFLDSLFADIE